MAHDYTGHDYTGHNHMGNESPPDSLRCFFVRFSNGQLIHLRPCLGEPDLPFLQAVRGLNLEAGPDTSVSDALQQQLVILQTIERAVEQIMLNLEDYKRVLDEVNAHTNRIGTAVTTVKNAQSAEIARLQAILAANGLNGPEETEVMERLVATNTFLANVATNLEATAANINTPAPPLAPPPVFPPEPPAPVLPVA